MFKGNFFDVKNGVYTSHTWTTVSGIWGSLVFTSFLNEHLIMCHISKFVISLMEELLLFYTLGY